MGASTSEFPQPARVPINARDITPARNLLVFIQFLLNFLNMTYCCPVTHGIVRIQSGRPHQPLTAPSIRPFSKYLCIKGYTHRIGIIVTIEMVYWIILVFICPAMAVVSALLIPL